MKASILFTASLAAGASARVIVGRQRPQTSTTRGGPPDVSQCGLDSFEGHTSEALLFCSSLLKSGTATQTVSVTSVETTTRKTTLTLTLQPSSTRRPPTPTPTPTSTPSPPTSTPRPSSSSSTPRPSSSPRPSSTLVPSSTIATPSSSPTPTSAPGCGIVGYTKDTAAYYFDSSGTQNTFAACSAACKADAQCKSFGYGEANCMLFTVNVASNTNINPTSPYTFYDATCPAEIPVKKGKRQLGITIGNPGIGITVTFDGPSGPSSACSCFIGSGPAGVTKTTTATVTSRATSTSTVTKTVTNDGDFA